MNDRSIDGEPHRTNGWIAAAALGGAVSVIAGAFAAHGLDAVADAKPIEYLHTGSQYQATHALAILAVAALAASGRLNLRVAQAALWFFLGGSIVFPLTLYGLALGGPLWLGAVTPIGGAAFILGWATLAIAALVRSK